MKNEYVLECDNKSVTSYLVTKHVFGKKQECVAINIRYALSYLLFKLQFRISNHTRLFNLISFQFSKTLIFYLTGL